MSCHDLYRWLTRLAAGLVAVVFASGLALAQTQAKKSDFGKREYDSKCAVCHGATGKGDGIYKPYLTKSPTDLTVLSKANKGVFPFEYVYDVVDGRKGVPAHGPSDMPVWGAAYLSKAAGEYMDVPYDPEFYVRTRILALVEYISRLQVK